MSSRARIRSGLMQVLRTRSMIVLGFGLTIAVAGLLGLSYQSLLSGVASSRVLAERRAEVILGLLTSSLDRDMKAAQVSVLVPFRPNVPNLHEIDELRDRFVRAFSRFPYPESFFVWSQVKDPKSTIYIFHRPDRLPRWTVTSQTPTRYPAVLIKDDAGSDPLTPLLRPFVKNGSHYVVIDTALGSEPYVIVAKALTNEAGEVVDFVGFTINMVWLREHYFNEVAEAVLRVRDSSDSASIVISDAAGRNVARAGTPQRGVQILRNDFAPAFVDPMVAPPSESAPAPWTMIATVDDSAPTPVWRGTGGIYVFLATTALASVVGMFMTARAVRLRAEAAEMHLEFVSTVTHELKTPLASIRLMGETLADARHDGKAVREFARLLSGEAWRLTRLIDNLLAYAAVSHTGRQLTEPHEAAELLEDVLAHFHAQLADRQFEVSVDIPLDLPRIRGDRTMLCNALENVIDNAIKYSGQRRVLVIRGRHEEPMVFIEVIDQGDGIAAEDLPQVCDKFFRGRSARASGSGLGLAIVRRITDEHMGSIEVTSEVGVGTQVRLGFPAESRMDA